MSALLKDSGLNDAVSAEARQRINHARILDLAFHIRRSFAGESLSVADAEMLAAIVLDGVDSNLRVDRNYVCKELVARGRSPHKAEELSGTLFK